MSFPWGQSTLAVTFTCPHCGDVKSIVRGDKVPACDCPGAREEGVLERQRSFNHAQDMEEAYQARMRESRDKRRERRGNIPSDK